MYLIDQLKSLITYLIAKDCYPNILHKLRWFDQKARLPNLLRRLNVNVVIDVGANVGQFASELRQLGYKGRIVSFEPCASAFVELGRHFATDLHWRGHQVALGSQQHWAVLNQTGASTLNSLLKPNKLYQDLFPDANRIQKSTPIEVRRLDEYFETIIEGIENPRVFLKMDTQGYDRNVIRGLGTHVHHVVGLQSEISMNPIYDHMTTDVSILQEYGQLGFELLDLFPVTRHKNLGFILEYDCIMSRAETSLVPSNGQSLSANGL